MRIEQNYSLEQHNTFHLPAKTRWFMEYETEEELEKILHDEYFQECLSTHIGSGSNLLFINDYNGIILHSTIKGINVVSEDDDHVIIRVGAAELWDDVVAFAVSKGWFGIENLSLIPGETGAAAVQNIGAYGVEIKDIVKEVRCFDVVTGGMRSLSVKDCRYGYRDSVFKDSAKGRYVVVSVVFRLSSEARPRLEYGHVRKAVEEAGGSLSPAAVRKVILEIRNSKLPDPAVMGSAGSFFKNPVVPKSSYDIVENYAKGKYGQEYEVPHFDAGSGFVKIPAAWLIEQCGWKGYTEGNVGVYEKQPLVIINATGQATPEEIIALEYKIIISVQNLFGITLQPEVEHV